MTTTDPDEWEDRTAMSSSPLWQNRRDPAAFSRDGGQTWHFVDEPSDAVTTPPTTLHDTLRAELDRRLAVARAATPGPWDLGIVYGTVITSAGRDTLAKFRILADAEFGELHDPADAIRRYTGELEVLERHAIVWRDIGWLEDGDERYEELPVCGRCVPKHSHFRTRAEVPVGACDETKGVASRLGVSVDA
jgi:hypothetical protein